MTVQEILGQTEKMLSAPVEEALQKSWIYDLELQLWQEVFCACEDAPGKPAMGDALLVDAPYQDVYVYHILQKEALLHGDTEQYNQYTLLFSSRYREFSAWYLRNHKPCRGGH